MHCHAGLGRTGTAIATYLVFAQVGTILVILVCVCTVVLVSERNAYHTDKQVWLQAHMNAHNFALNQTQFNTAQHNTK